MSAMASLIPSLTIVYLAAYSGTDLRKHQSSASLAFVWGIHWGPVNSPHKRPVTQKMSPFDDVNMQFILSVGSLQQQEPVIRIQLTWLIVLRETFNSSPPGQNPGGGGWWWCGRCGVGWVGVGWWWYWTNF